LRGDAVTAEDPLQAATEAPTQTLATEFSGAEDAPSVVDGGVLAGEEMRTRMGALRVLCAALILLIAIVSFMPDKTGLTWALLGVYALAAAVIFVLILVSRKRQYSSGVSTVIGVMVVFLVLGSCLYFGFIGGPVIILPPVVYYYGLGDSKPRRRWVAAAAIGGHVLLMVLVALGLVPPLGMIPADALVRGDYVLITGSSTTTLLVATYWLSFRSRRSTLLAMAELERARRGIRQRDALLHEAHVDLDRAVAGARVGRLTGRNIDGFQLGSVVGRGAMGEVYQATSKDSGQEVAFKVLHPHLSESRKQVSRFFREAQIIAALESPHIPKLFASGTDEDGAPYLVLELLHGLDLAADLRQRKSLVLTEIDALVEQVCLALHAAHEAGVVHRDIKPQNLFLTVEPRVAWKVLDFGVSMMASGSGTLTQGGAVGTPAYMAPEQALGVGVDRRADVFSLGAVVYRALTGRPAFSGTSNAATVYAAVHYQPIRPGELSNVDADIDAVLALALAKKAGLRLASARDFASAWKSARQHRFDGELRKAAERLLAAHPWGTDYSASKRLSG
jgi:eukaryotic-like serine/threonine-protein kinase